MRLRTLILVSSLIGIVLIVPLLAYAQEEQEQQKAVVLTFDDNYRSQYEFVRPLLEKYGFNATFFIYCQLKDGQLSWNEIRDLDKRGFDIQAHSMTHMNLEHASAADLVKEVSDSRYCIEDEVMSDVDIFATPFASGAENQTVLQAIRDAGYKFARAGYSNHFDLNCDRHSEPGCQLFYTNGTMMKEQNRYNIPTSNMNGLWRDHSNGSVATGLQSFKQQIEKNIDYDDQGKLTALPVLVYHNFSSLKESDINAGKNPNIPMELFEQEMKYLADQNYVVLSMDDLEYDSKAGSQVFSIPALEE